MGAKQPTKVLHRPSREEMVNGSLAMCYTSAHTGVPASPSAQLRKAMQGNGI
jgi:hypothetical protein